MKLKQDNGSGSRWFSWLAVACVGLVTFSVAAKDCDHWNDVDPFANLYVTAPVELVLEQGQQSAVCVSTAQHQLEIQSIDGVLYVDAPSSSAQSGVRVHVRSAIISDIYVDAAASVRSDAITASRLVLESHGPSDIRLSNVQVQDLVVGGFGSANFHLSGAATHQSVEIDGVGAYLAQGLASETSQVSVRGAGRVELWVEEILDVDILGAASVLYGGSPWVSQRITGRGAVGRF